MYRSFIKRILDILFSLIGLALLAVLFPFVFLAIKGDDRGPVFYLDQRLGINEKRFTMFKFRSMKVDAPDIRNVDGTTYNSADDPRLTRVGKWLRKSSVDELPQFLNVLKGDMSVVGPRPSPLGDKSQYPPEFFMKFQVRPGITGYNQVVLRNAATMEQRIANDVYYVEHLSFRLDFRIVLTTIKNVFMAKNIHRA